MLPTNEAERGVSSALSLLGAVIFSFLIGSIGSLVYKGNTVEVAIQQRVAYLQDLCSLKSMPQELSRRVRSQAEEVMKLAPGLLAEVDPLNVLPRSLRSELLVYQSMEALGRVKLLSKLDRDARARLAAVLRPCSFAVNQEVFRTFDAATEMYFVVHGTLQYCNHTGEQVDTVQPGEPLGELEMFPELLPIMVPMRAHTASVIDGPCLLLELRLEDLQELVRVYMPDVYLAIKATAVEAASLLDTDALCRAIRAHTSRRCRPLHSLASKRAVKYIALKALRELLVSRGRGRRW